MKILHITPSFYPAHIYGGPTLSVYQLCCHLAEKGHEVKVLTTDANGLDQTLDVEKNKEVEIMKNLDVIYCRRLAINSISSALLRRLPSYIRWADVVHLTAVYSFPTFPTLLISRLYHKPLVWSPRGALQRWGGSKKVGLKALWDFICEGLLPEKLVLHLTSDEEGEEGIRRIRRVKTAVIPNGVEIPELTSGTSRRNGVFRLLYLGRIDPKKGIENLLSSCQILKSDTSFPWTLTLAGGGIPSYWNSIKERVQVMGLSDKVTMVGEVKGDIKQKLFEDSEMVIVPSYAENFGIVVAEALAHGVPVIASRGTPWKRVEELGCGLWVENDPQSLAKAIRQMSGMPLNEMGLKGREWMKKEFTWEEVAEKMIKLYKDLYFYTNG